jgi:osmotically-inducible protein OsmY
MQKPNDFLEHDVRDELDWDASLDGSRITVEASDDHVLLPGAVQKYVERLEHYAA